ncbi:hypothetical protein KL916_003453 [Ogataea parapolymorpha]|nr:hypothetical protein KL916_003453 [Ogataea parapolymorpha]
MKNSTVDGLLPIKFPATLAAEEVAEGASDVELINLALKQQRREKKKLIYEKAKPEILHMITVKAKRQGLTVFVSVPPGSGVGELKQRLAEMLNSAGGLLLHSEPVGLSQTDVDVPVPSFEEAEEDEEAAQSDEAEEGREKVTAEGLRIAVLDDEIREVDELELHDGLAVAFAWGDEQFSVAQPQE